VPHEAILQTFGANYQRVSTHATTVPPRCPTMNGCDHVFNSKHRLNLLTTYNLRYISIDVVQSTASKLVSYSTVIKMFIVF